MKFGEVQSHLQSGGCIARECWSDYPHKAFYAKQIDCMIVVDVDNKIQQSALFDCQVMANDWYIKKDDKTTDTSS